MPCAGQHHVVGDDHPHGISARRSVAPASSEPPTAPTRSARCCGREPRGAPSSSTTIDEAIVLADGARGGEARSAPARVLDRLGDGRVGGRLDGRRQARRFDVAELDRQRRLVGQRGEGGREARLAEDRREDAVGQLAQLLQRGRGLLPGRVQQPHERRVAAGASEPQVVGEREQLLLRAVVEVALQPAPLRVARRDDAGARGAQLADLGEQLGAQRLVLHGEPGGGSERRLELLLVQERAVVQHQGERAPAPRDASDRAPGSRLGRDPAVGVDQPARAGARVQDLDPVVAERGRERLAELAGRRRFPELARDPGDARPRAPDAHDAPGQPERERRQRGRAGEEDRGEAGASGILEPVAQQRDGVRRLGGGHQQRGSEERSGGAPRRPGAAEQPACAERDQAERDRERRPQPDVAERAGDARVGMGEEAVVAAVAPAVEVEQRVAEERPADAHRRGDRVGRGERRTRRRRADPAAGQRQREVQDQRERERRDQRAQASQQRRCVFGALPAGAEPGHGREQREQAEPPRPRLRARERAGQHEAQARGGAGDACGGQRGGVRRRRVGAGVDGDDRADRPGERRRGEGEHGRPRSGAGACVRHRPILPPTAVASHSARGQNRVARPDVRAAVPPYVPRLLAKR